MANHSYRFGLYTREYNHYVRGKEVTSLKIILNDRTIDLLGSIATYVGHGSLTSTEIVDWIKSHRCEDPARLFLFELDVDGTNHCYRLLGSQKNIFKLFTTHWK